MAFSKPCITRPASSSSSSSALPKHTPCPARCRHSGERLDFFLPSNRKLCNFPRHFHLKRSPGCLEEESSASPSFSLQGARTAPGLQAHTRQPWLPCHQSPGLGLAPPECRSGGRGINGSQQHSLALGFPAGCSTHTSQGLPQLGQRDPTSRSSGSPAGPGRSQSWKPPSALPPPHCSRPSGRLQFNPGSCNRPALTPRMPPPPRAGGAAASVISQQHHQCSPTHVFV